MSSSSIDIKPLPSGRQTTLDGSIVCPPDKSVTHRSVMLAAMATGTSRVHRPLMGADCRSTMGVFRALGVVIDESPDEVQIVSPGWDGWASPLTPLDFGNSGTTARLLTGVFAATPGLFVTAFGDGSLSKRPMGRVVEPLRACGAQIWGRDGGRLLPMAVQGAQLRPAHHTVDKATAQVKSALLLAGLNASGETSVTLPAGSRDHTEKMLAALGASVTVSHAGRVETVVVRGPFRPPARSYEVPGDPSSAAFFAVLGALTGGRMRICRMLDNPTRTGFLTLLKRMGVRLTLTASPVEAGSKDLLEPIVDVTVAGGVELRGVDMEAELAPTLIDEIPILAVAALFAAGPTRLRGLGELRVKESDRLAKTVELLTLAGGKAWTEGDDLCIAGGLSRANAFVFDPDEDHRLAMAAGVLAKVAGGSCRVHDPACVAVSFPGFFDALGSLG